MPLCQFVPLKQTAKETAGRPVLGLPGLRAACPGKGDHPLPPLNPTPLFAQDFSGPSFKLATFDEKI